MCGRYLFDPTTGELSEYYQEAAAKARKRQQTVAVNDVFPSNHVVTIGANQQQQVVAGVTRWGFTGFKKEHLMINARSETVEEKPTFRKPFQEHRCVFPMSGFYEWNHEKEKFLFSQDHVIYAAGFYRILQKEDQIETESIILTTAANDSVEPVHDRMPLFLEKEAIASWINDLAFARQQLKAEMPKLKTQMLSS
ncbi:hypothetical protein BH739_00230 [Enterococcus casseliflavus]|nr:hypothetical protein BH739_00230 [Enterococcus casseliflavus]